MKDWGSKNYILTGAIKYSAFYVAVFYFMYSLSQSLNTQDTLSFSNSRHVHFIPTSFSNSFSLNVTPVLTIRTDDTVSTETIDAAGFDKNSVKRQHGGNPLTGPFYIDNSMAGDILGVTLVKVSLNRSYAFTTESFGSRALLRAVTKQFKKAHNVRCPAGLI